MSIQQYDSVSITDFSILPTQGTPDYNIYSPDLFGNTLYLGGWLTAADIGPDQLYQSIPTEDAPQPIVWDGAVPYSLYHLNDPSVVEEADGTLAMFMTALPNYDTTWTEIVTQNITALATSDNGGASWIFRGIVIGQDNGLAGTGAWSPSALPDGDDIDVWYNTGAIDADTGASVPIQVQRATMNPIGTQVLSTVVCVNALTGAPIPAENVDVAQASDGTYWMIGNDYLSTDGNPGKLVLYESQDGINWTPWSINGPTLISPSAGQTLLTPTITGISGNTLTLMYSEQAGTSATMEHTVTVALSDQPDNPRFLQAFVVDGVQTSSESVDGQDYNGPVTYLQSQLIYTGNGNLNMVALTPNAFLCGGSGNDGLVATSGDNVLDGGTGSNFLIGGSGQDVFFLDTESGVNTWTTVSNFKAGDQITVWDITPAQYNLAWFANQGAPNATGATIHVPEGQDAWSSLTLAGWSVSAAETISAAFGSIDGRSYLHFTT